MPAWACNPVFPWTGLRDGLARFLAIPVLRSQGVHGPRLHANQAPMPSRPKVLQHHPALPSRKHNHNTQCWLPLAGLGERLARFLVISMRSSQGILSPRLRAGRQPTPSMPGTLQPTPSRPGTLQLRVAHSSLSPIVHRRPTWTGLEEALARSLVLSVRRKPLHWTELGDAVAPGLVVRCRMSRGIPTIARLRANRLSMAMVPTSSSPRTLLHLPGQLLQYRRSTT
mmetsp:Transcript_143824/g.459589  ORF Transcript_143824/g.459589 Transcript_143824/m.459589 type:complete len:226 (+) Transcript_143824:604-1281(+)